MRHKTKVYGPQELPKKPSLYKGWFDCSNAKAAVGVESGYLNAIHYMAPHNSAGGETVCPWAARCVKPCLTASGKGGVPGVKQGRINRTRAFLADPMAYARRHIETIDGTGKRTNKYLLEVARMYGLVPALRLNGTSDIPWEKESFGIFQRFPNLVKYDYTKGWERVLDWLQGSRGSLGHGFRSGGAGDFRSVKNYHLTLSLGGVLDRRPEASRVYQEVLDAGGTIAAVWASKDAMHRAMQSGIDSFKINDGDGRVVNEISLGRPRRVIDGNAGKSQGGNGDLRFLDEGGVIVGLYAKQGTLHLDAGQHVKFFMANPSSLSGGGRSRSASVTGLPMGAMRQSGPHLDIDA